MHAMDTEGKDYLSLSIIYISFYLSRVEWAMHVMDTEGMDFRTWVR